MRTEGLSGPHGVLSLKGVPGFYVECVTRRKERLLGETSWARLRRKILIWTRSRARVLPVMKCQYPEIVDVAMAGRGDFSQLDIVAIESRIRARAKRHGMQFGRWGGQHVQKVIVVVDHDVNITIQ